MTPLVQVVLAGIGTYLIRLSAIAFSGRMGEPSERTTATLRLIGPAVLAAIVADRLFLTKGAIDIQLDWLIASVIAALVAWKWRAAGITMAVGMVAVWTLAALADLIT